MIIGGVVEFVPTALVRANVPTIATVQPYTPLEVEGRDLYIREGCVGCHSQMVRPIRAETERYGEYSKAGEFVYDHPFLWGSKRTGPDLHRVGGKYPDSWHYLHMTASAATSPGSIMPGYPWLYDAGLDTSHIEGKIITLRRLGVPYPVGYEQPTLRESRAAALGRTARPGSAGRRVAAGLKQAGMAAPPDREIVALIAYLQRLGTDIKAAPAAERAGTGAAAPATEEPADVHRHPAQHRRHRGLSRRLAAALRHRFTVVLVWTLRLDRRARPRSRAPAARRHDAAPLARQNAGTAARRTR